MFTTIYVIGIFTFILTVSNMTYNSTNYASERTRDITILTCALMWPILLVLALVVGAYILLYFMIHFILRLTGLSLIEHMLIQFLPKKYKNTELSENLYMPEQITESKSKKILIVDVNNAPKEVVSSVNPDFVEFGMVVAMDKEDNTFRFIKNRITEDTTTIYNLDDFDSIISEIIESDIE